jgi:addiction module HigA family antidote
MTEFSTRDPRRCPAHPGRILREYAVPALEIPKTAIAEHLGISRQTLYDLLAEKQPVTPQMAVRIGKLLGNGPALWLNMQTAYDLWHAKREIDVSDIPTFISKKVAAR